MSRFAAGREPADGQPSRASREEQEHERRHQRWNRDKMSESARTSAVPTLRRLPVMMPAGIPTSVARISAVAPRSAVFHARSATSCRTGRPVLDRFAEIEPHGAAQPVAVAREATGDRVRGDDARPRRPRDRDRTRRPNRRARPRPASAPPTRRRTRAAPRRAGAPKQIGHAGDYLAAASVSALQSSCGASGAGVGLRTLGEVASVTREATK